MNKRIFLGWLCVMTCIFQMQAQKSREKVWGIQAGIGAWNIADDTPDEQPLYLGDDEANRYYVSMDYYLRKHLVLTGGLYFDRVGLLDELSANDVGVKKITNTGFMVGVKYYFLPQRWVIQPFVGASVRANFSHLSPLQTQEKYTTDIYSSQTPTRFTADYDVQCPALSLNPRLGVDIRLISSVSLSIDYDLSYGLWGHNRQKVSFQSGPNKGVVTRRQMSRFQTGPSIGLKVEFPLREVRHAPTLTDIATLIFDWLYPYK
jgi:hypothetical protein